MTHQRVAYGSGLPPIIFHYQNLIAGDQAYKCVIGKFVQLTSQYEDFRANFSNGGRLRLWDCSQLQSWSSPTMAVVSSRLQTP